MDDFLKTIGSVVGSVAPTIATALGGPLAGTATSAIVEALGLPADTPREELAARIQQASPADLLALKEADARFAVEMKRLDIDLAGLVVADKASARAREVSVKDRIPAVLAILITVGLFAMIAGLMLYDVPAGNKSTLDILAGNLSGAFGGGVIGYYFGMSYKGLSPGAK